MTRLGTRALVGSTVLLALATGFLGGTLAVQPAQAQTVRTAVCAVPPRVVNTEKNLELQAGWMTEQLAAGKSDFFLQGAALCAW